MRRSCNVISSNLSSSSRPPMFIREPLLHEQLTFVAFLVCLAVVMDNGLRNPERLVGEGVLGAPFRTFDANGFLGFGDGSQP